MKLENELKLFLLRSKSQLKSVTHLYAEASGLNEKDRNHLLEVTWDRLLRRVNWKRLPAEQPDLFNLNTKSLHLFLLFEELDAVVEASKKA